MKSKSVTKINLLIILQRKIYVKTFVCFFFLSVIHRTSNIINFFDYNTNSTLTESVVIIISHVGNDKLYFTNTDNSNYFMRK